jgi:eukaryotic-like serine/threonine-protein kinase
VVKSLTNDPEDNESDLTGKTIGRFTIGACLGKGGMGEVYRAEDTQLKRTVAIKRLTTQSGDKPYRNELLKEAQRASSLNDPRIAVVHDVFSEGRELFLVMEYVDGPTLRDRMDEPIVVSEFCDIAIQCMQALVAAHEKGILHGDVKPANIMLTRDKTQVKVCDFGLSRRISTSHAASSDLLSTVRMGLVGTPAYMAPEVVLEKTVDLAADVFSMGVVFYELLAGKNPFLADNMIGTVDRIRSFSPQSLDQVNTSVPPRLAQCIQRMIEKNPDNRPAATELLEDLLRIRADLTPRGRTWIDPRRVSFPAAVNLVVLPFGVLGGDRDKESFTQGLRESLNTQLSKLTVNRNFQVAPSNDIRARNVTNATDAREQLGANLVLKGALEYEGDRVSITCTIVDAKSGKPLRTETSTMPVSESLAVQERVLEMVVKMMGFVLTPPERTEMARHGTKLPGAFDFYLQGQGYLLNYDRIENIENAVSVFRRALDIDPRYALAYAGLAEAYWRKYQLTKNGDWVDLARGACESALGIDPDAAQPHACLGMVLTGRGEYEKAAEEYEFALDREPTNDLFCLNLATAYEKAQRPADAEQTYLRGINLRPHYWAAYNNLGVHYYRHARFDDALAMFQQVVALAPDSFRGYRNLGAVYFTKNNNLEAINSFETSLAIRPNYEAASNLGTLYYFEGEYHRSAEAFRKALSINQGDYKVWNNLAGALESAGEMGDALAAYRRAKLLAEQELRVNPRNVDVHMVLAPCYWVLDEKIKSKKSLEQVLQAQPDSPHILFRLAVFHELRLGQRDEALKWLTKAIERGQTWGEVDRTPLLRDLRMDPRFQQIRRGDSI